MGVMAVAVEIVVMPVMSLMIVVIIGRGRIGLFLQPAPDIQALAGGIVEAGIEEGVGIEPTGDGLQYGRARIEAAQPLLQQLRLRCEIAFGQHEAVGNGGLLDGFHLPIKLVHAVHRIHGGDDAVEAIDLGQHRVLHQRVEDGRRIGETRGFDDDAAEEGKLLRGATLVQATKRRHEIAADGAAKTAAGEQHHVLARRFHQHMVEADLPELVDDDGGLAESRITQQLAQQGRLAAAEEAGQHRDGEPLHRRRRACCLCRRGLGRRAHRAPLRLWSAKSVRLSSMTAPA